MKTKTVRLVVAIMVLVTLTCTAIAERVTLDDILRYDSRLSADVICAYNEGDPATIYVYAGNHFTIELTIDTSTQSGYLAMYESGHSTDGEVVLELGLDVSTTEGEEVAEQLVFAMVKEAIETMNCHGWWD